MSAQIPYKQVLLVFVVFGAMVVAGSLFGRNIDYMRVERESDFMANYVESVLNTEFRELEAMLDTVSKTVSNMIITGADFDTINEYVVNMTNYGYNSEKYIGFLSFFALFEGVFETDRPDGYSGFSGMGAFPENFEPHDRPWYILSKESGSNITATQPYPDTMIDGMVFAYVRNIYDENEKRLGVVCMNVLLDSIYEFPYKNLSEFVVDWMLFDTNLNLVAHFDADIVGMNLREIPSGLAVMAEELQQGHEITGYVYKNHLGNTKVITVTLLENGWYLGVTTLLDGHREAVYTIFLFLLVVGLLLASILSAILIHISREKSKMEQRVQLMLDMSPLGIILLDTKLKVIECNGKALSMFGFDKTSKQEFCTDFHSFSPKYQPNGRSTADCQRENIEKAFERGTHVFEWEHVKPTGESLPCKITLVRSIREKDQVVVAYMKDLRELKLAEEKTRKIYETMQKLLESMDTMIIITECESDKIIYLNDSFKNEFGVDEDIIGKQCWKSLFPGAKGRCRLCPKSKMSHDSDETVSREYFNTQLNKYYRIASRFIDWPDGMRVFMEQCVDITELRQSIAQIDKAREDAEGASKIKSVFLANMSHEIRTPMNSIMGFAELAQYSDLPPKAREYIQNISESSKWLLNIINDILDISKIEAGKITLENIPFDLRDVLSHCQSVIKHEVEEKGITLYCYAEPSIGGKLIGDPVRLRQALMNLLSNAVKFTNQGLIKMLVSVVETDEKNITLQFEIKDSGIGMDCEQIARIFEPFTQADGSITRRYGGTGLGLSITNSIVKLMGGQLKAESTIGVGSKFNFSLTFEMVDDATKIQSQEIVLDISQKPFFRGEVLICEDNNLNQQVICDHLSSVGLKTVVADNGKEGIDIIARRLKGGSKPFDLILMDIHMPVMDGLEAASKIAQMGIKIPVVAVTANVMSNDIDLYKASGMSDCIGKPFTANELWKCLVKFLPIQENAASDNRQAPGSDDAHDDDDDDKIKNRLLTIFVKDNQSTYKNFIKALDEGDIKLAHRIVHTIKSSAAQIKEFELREAALTAETALSDNQNNLTPEHIRNFQREMKAALEKYARFYVKKSTPSYIKPIITDTAEIKILFDKLEVLLENNDSECLELLDEIRAVEGTDKLAGLIEDYDFTLAGEVLNKLRQEL
jgi:signal transduction histidine kinase/CheY-like chemotaxis protein